MTRKEEIIRVAIKEFPLFAERRAGFIAGAEWADANPERNTFACISLICAYQAKKRMIDKACKFLKSYRQETPDGMGYINGIVNDKTIEDFKKHMEE